MHPTLCTYVMLIWILHAVLIIYHLKFKTTLYSMQCNTHGKMAAKSSICNKLFGKTCTFVASKLVSSLVKWMEKICNMCFVDIDVFDNFTKNSRAIAFIKLSKVMHFDVISCFEYILRLHLHTFTSLESSKLEIWIDEKSKESIFVEGTVSFKPKKMVRSFFSLIWEFGVNASLSVL